MGQGTLFHDVHAQRIVRDLHQKIEAVRRCLQRIHVLRKAFPVPHNAFVQGGARNVFHAFHELDQIVFSTWALGCKTHTAVAHDHRGHTVVDARGEAGVPGYLPVIVGVQVDKPRRDPEACGIDGFFGSFVDLTDLSDAPSFNADICDEWFLACAVNHGAVFNQAIEHLFFSKHTPKTCHSQCAKYPTSWPRSPCLNHC